MAYHNVWLTIFKRQSRARLHRKYHECSQALSVSLVEGVALGLQDQKGRIMLACLCHVFVLQFEAKFEHLARKCVNLLTSNDLMED